MSWESNPKSKGADKPDVFILLKRLEVNREYSTDFAEALENWLKLPIDQLSQAELDAEAMLGSRYSENLRIKFGPNSNIIDEGHPIANFAFMVGGVLSSFSYPADQSCVRNVGWHQQCPQMRRPFMAKDLNEKITRCCAYGLQLAKLLPRLWRS